MEAGGTFVITLIVIIFLVYTIYRLIKKKEEKDKINLQSDWEYFLSAIKRNDIEEINNIGLQLIWNTKLSYDQFNFLSGIIQEKVKEHDIFKELNEIVYNKKLHKAYGKPYGNY
jgi:predicted membrane protein